MLLGDLVSDDLTLPVGARGIDITGLSADSRVIEDGYLFAALPGSTVDGTRFAGDAVERGAVAIVAGRTADVDVADDIAVVRSDDPRRALAMIAARFYPLQPDGLVAVTGTSGKTSVVSFARQIFEAAGKNAASIGTLGIVTRDRTEPGNLTTPDPIVLHMMLDRLAGVGVTHGAIEASSHGLDQRRLDGLRLVAAGFTNLGRDHLDYHANIEDYFAAKLRLFSEILPEGVTAVIDMDGEYSEEVATIATHYGQTIVHVGWAGRDLRLVEALPDELGQALKVEAFGEMRKIKLPLAGSFQASNALVAAGLAIGAGIDKDAVLGSLEGLSGASGRVELVGRKANGGKIFVDYAHKPNALESVLKGLRPLTLGRLIVIVGAGGDRDTGKRALMGEAAARFADAVVITDDNPRSEDPAAIRKEIMAGAPGAEEIGDRAEAIRQGITVLGPGDVLCVAGKGHETGQIVGTETLDFSDHEVVRSVLAAEETE